MSRLLLGVIVVVTVSTSLEGLPTENPMSHIVQVMEIHEAHQEDDNVQDPASVMGTSVDGDTAVQTMGRTTDQDSVDNCTGILSHAQVQDIQFQQSDWLYVIINGQLVARESPLDLYIEVFKIVTQMVETNSVTNVWLNKAPCPACIEYLELIFSPFIVKPILHVESLNYRGSNYEVLRDFGCLAKLKSRNYQLKAWDWDVFRATYGGSCDYHSAIRHNTGYMTQKSTTKIIVDHVEGNLMSSSLVKLCELEQFTK